MFAESLKKRMSLGVWHVVERRSEPGERIYDHQIANGKLQTKILGKKEDVLEMPHHGLFARAVGAADLNDVETERQILRIRTKPTEISSAGPEHDLSLFPVNRIKPGNQGVRRSCFHFHKYQHLAIAAYQIDFVTPITRASPVSRYDSIILFLAQKISREPLPLGTRPGPVGPVRSPPPIFKP